MILRTQRAGRTTSILAVMATSLGALASACSSGSQAPVAKPAAPAAPAATPVARAEPPSSEPHLRDLRQLTFGGENAEAYWSFDGKQLIMQAHSGEGCDRIYRLTPGASPVQVSSGKGATTCSY